MPGKQTTISDSPIELIVSPDDCDPSGSVGLVALVRFFERARWDHLALGPGIDVFHRAGVRPAIRRSVVDCHTPARVGDRLRFSQILTHLGRTSFTLRQTANHALSGVTVATAEILFVCLDRADVPQPVPEDLGLHFSARPAGDPVDRVTVNGVNLAIETRGSGPAVLFLHGFPLDRTIFRHQLDTLTGYRRIALDLRGMGRSDAPDLGYSMATYADDVVAVLDVLGEDRVVVCGLSMGGYVALEMLRRYRHRVGGLVMMDSRAEADSAEGRKARDALVTKVREFGPVAAAEAMLPRFFAEGVSDEIIASVRGMILRTPIAGIVGALAAMRDRPDSTPLLGTLLGLPSLILVGQHDTITPPAVARAMAAAIPEARLVEVPNSGHLPCVEQPVPTTRAVLKFLQSLK